MTPRSLALRFRRSLHNSRLAQIAAIFVFWGIGETIVRLAGLPVPGGIVGMALVLALLISGRLSLFSMRRGAQWFLAEMILFFVPAVLAVVDHREFVGLLGLKILFVILAGTASVMAVTALTADLYYRRRLAAEDRNALFE
ncbi:holin-like protein [Rhodopseudomonas julia]|uniref:Holin-like protein n=1 Tax=Rhodopseudomonas julia TaxID=200617 RepID=A0ABU0C7N9_9BRAD|nr:CidA/LrgA family protein [Rhodopseudomonas julia]MDQ0326538.1 holin-like protein [Rhodopseudomonas julia]